MADNPAVNSKEDVGKTKESIINNEVAPPQEEKASDEESSDGFDLEVDTEEEEELMQVADDQTPLAEESDGIKLADSDPNSFEGGSEDDEGTGRPKRSLSDIKMKKKSRGLINLFKNKKPALKEIKNYTTRDFLSDITDILNADLEASASKKLKHFAYFDTKLERLVGIYEIIILLMQGMLTPSLLKM